MNKILVFDTKKESKKELSDPIQRLKQSVAEMDAGTRNMRDRVGEFRANLGELNLEMKKLKSSFKDLHASMGKIDIHRLRHKSLRLGQIMDESLRSEDEAA